MWYLNSSLCRYFQIEQGRINLWEISATREITFKQLRERWQLGSYCRSTLPVPPSIHSPGRQWGSPSPLTKVNSDPTFHGWQRVLVAGIGARRGSLQDDRANGARSHSSPRGRVAFEYVVFVARVAWKYFFSFQTRFIESFLRGYPSMLKIMEMSMKVDRSYWIILMEKKRGRRGDEKNLYAWKIRKEDIQSFYRGEILR